MTNWFRIFSYGFVLAVVGIAAYYAFRESPIPVDVSNARNGPMQVTINEEGVTRIRNVYQVFPPVSGHLERVSLEEGDNVEANRTVVGRMYPLDPPFLDRRSASEISAAIEAARSAVTLARVDLSRAEADLNLAEVEYQRALELQRNDVISKALLDKRLNVVLLRRAEVKSARAAIELKKAELKSVEARQVQPTSPEMLDQADSCCIEIKAPVSGTVLKIHHKSRQVIHSTTPIMDIGDPDDLEIAIDLLSSDAVKIEPGSRVIVSEWGQDRPLEAIVRRIDPAGFTKVSALGIEEQRVNVVLDLVDVPPGLGHGYRVFANFVIWSGDAVLQIPIGALFRRAGKWAVFKVEDDRVHLQFLTLGRLNDAAAQVLEGLSNEDQVVLYPNDQLEDGTLIRLR